MARRAPEGTCQCEGACSLSAWLASQGRSPESFNAVERLCYTGARGMGALEFAPTTGPVAGQSKRMEMDKLVELASRVLGHRNDFQGSFAAGEIIICLEVQAMIPMCLPTQPARSLIPSPRA